MSWWSWWRAIPAVVWFELQRSLTWARLCVWGLLVLFPAAIVLCVKVGQERPFDPRVWIFVLYALVTEFTTCLGILLCVAPAIQVELEKRSWPYLAVRPYGRRVVLLGKYFWALVATLSASWLALVPAVLLAQPPNSLRTYGVLAVLSIFSAAGRGAVYALVAVIFPQRAMTFAVAYTLVMEYFVGWIPAIVNQLTVQFHVRCLLMRWMQLDQWMGGLRLFFDEAPASRHVAALVVYVVVVLLAALIILERRSFVDARET